MLTQNELKRALRFDPETGEFVRLASKQQPRLIGKATSRLPGLNGYLRIHVGSKRYSAHRLAWLYMTGQWPSQEVDHINGDRSDNRWCNLREVSRRMNAQNLRSPRTDSRSRVLGVSWDGARKKWVTRIKLRELYT